MSGDEAFFFPPLLFFLIGGTISSFFPSSLLSELKSSKPEESISLDSVGAVTLAAYGCPPVLCVAVVTRLFWLRIDLSTGGHIADGLMDGLGKEVMHMPRCGSRLHSLQRRRVRRFFSCSCGVSAGVSTMGGGWHVDSFVDVVMEEERDKPIGLMAWNT